MSYYFSITFDEKPDFFRLIAVNEDIGLVELQQTVLAACNYLPNIGKLSLASDNESIYEEILPEEFSENKAKTVESTTLEEVISREDQLIFFEFDNFSQRSFRIQLIQKIENEKLDSPLCTEESGNPPPPMEVFTGDIDFSAFENN